VRILGLFAILLVPIVSISGDEPPYWHYSSESWCSGVDETPTELYCYAHGSNLVYSTYAWLQAYSGGYIAGCDAHVGGIGFLDQEYVAAIATLECDAYRFGTGHFKEWRYHRRLR